jgi:hypothetical protein
MHHALGDSLVVEMEDLFTKMEIFDKCRSALANLQCVLIVGDRDALGRGKNGGALFCNLMQLTAVAAEQCLLVNLCAWLFPAYSGHCSCSDG